MMRAVTGDDSVDRGRPQEVGVLDSSDTRAATSALDLEAYRALYEYGPDGVLFTAPDGRILAANPAACELLGLTEHEICARGRQGLADGADPRWGVLLAERERTGQAQGIGRMLRGDGVAIEVEMRSKLFTDARGETRSCTVIRDITARVRLERELTESRAQLAEAERMAHMGSWEWNLAEDRIAWSDGLLEIFGLSRDAFDPTYDRGLRRIYPDDRKRVRRAITRALAERSSFSLEFRAIRADGRVRVVRSVADVAVDDRGEPSRLVGVAQDITEETVARDVLRDASADLGRRATQLQALAVRGAADDAAAGQTAPLTARQLEILRLIAGGLTTGAIAERLVVTEGTVKWHVKQILAKTRSANRAEAVARVFGDTAPA
jgi:PAS domain S-box-containing protein